MAHGRNPVPHTGTSLFNMDRKQTLIRPRYWQHELATRYMAGRHRQTARPLWPPRHTQRTRALAPMGEKPTLTFDQSAPTTDPAPTP
jgi:hypothetical protein